MNLPPCEHCGESHSDSDRYCPKTGQLMATRLLPPNTLLEGKYLVRRAIGVGGMGAVFDATHTLLDKRVAIKVMLSADEESTQRFLREARAASSTGHRNIASVTDLGRTGDGQLFVVMDYLAGSTVKELSDKKPLAVERALRLVEQVLAGLVAVHKHGIVHRDLKPDNIMVITEEDDAELVKILDFGISKILGDDGVREGLTSTGIVMGTPLYMAPEQAQGKPVGPSADLYAAGGILYAMLTGRPPHLAQTLSELIMAKLEQPITPPSILNPLVPAAIDALVLRALALDPKDRFPRALDMRRAVLDCLGDQTALASCLTDPRATLPRPPEDDVLFNGELIALDGTSHEDTLQQAQLPAHALSAVDTGSATVAAPKRAGANGGAAARVRQPQQSPVRAAEPLPVPSGNPAPATAAIPGASDDAFAPPGQRELEMELELDKVAPLALGPRTAAPATSTMAPVQARTHSSGMLRVIALVVVLGAAAAAAYQLWGPRLQQVAQPPREIRISFDTSPASAEIFIDSVLLASQPLYLRASGRTYEARISARGYISQVVSFEANQDRHFKVALTPSPGTRIRRRRKRSGR